MFKKLTKIIFLLGVLGVFLFIAGSIATKRYFTNKATQKAGFIIETALGKKPSTPDEEIITIAKAVFERFRAIEPSQVPALRIRPYVSNNRLPDIFRFQDGVIETNIEKGLCDNASRMLNFLLSQKGYKSVQWNMVTDKNAHSALLVTMPDGRKVFVDPFYGLVAFDKEKNKLISPQEMLQNIKNGAALHETILAFSNKTKTDFYDHFLSVRMAAQGDFLQLKATLPRINSESLFLGKIDGKANDVKHQARQNNMTPFWEYMGHKYNREWVRILEADQNVRLEITLIDTVEDGIITATPKPKIDGKTMTWEIKAGEEIVFRDGLARINWNRLNSYIGVDRIALYPL